jgi:hypothetical protein
MATPASSRNIPYQFDGDKFRNAIRFVFEMETSTKQAPLFYFAETVTTVGTADSEIVPFDPRIPVNRVIRAPVTVPCDVTFEKAADEPTAFGVVVPARVTVLLLDGDYELVKDSIYVLINGDKYHRDYEIPDFALFDVGVHQITFVAENER